jgi:hypothetical protein
LKYICISVYIEKWYTYIYLYPFGGKDKVVVWLIYLKYSDESRNLLWIDSDGSVGGLLAHRG